MNLTQGRVVRTTCQPKCESDPTQALAALTIGKSCRPTYCAIREEERVTLSSNQRVAFVAAVISVLLCTVYRPTQPA